MANTILDIQLLAGSTSVANNSNVLFDNTIFTTGSISYNSATGVITISEAGQYLVNWWVATQSSSTPIGAVFAIRTTGINQFIGDSPIRTGQVTGVCVLNITAAPATFSLANISSAAFVYSNNLPVKAALVVSNIGSSGSGTSSSAIIPFASGTPVQLFISPGGAASIPAFVGFGSNASGIAPFGPMIDITGSIGVEAIDCAFSLPRDGTITSLEVLFSLGATAALAPGDYQVSAQLFLSSDSTNTFLAIPESNISLTPVFPSATATLGDIATGSADFTVAVTKGDRLMLVIYVTPPPTSVSSFFSGYVSAGLSIT